MKLTNDKIEKMSTKELTKNLQYLTRSILINYDFLELSSELLSNITVNSIETLKAKLINGSTQDYELLYTTIITSSLNKIIKDKLESKDEAVIIFVNYIKNNLKLSKKVDSEIKELNKFIEFLEQYNYILEPDVIEEIINRSNTLACLLKNFVNKNVKDGHIKGNFSDTIISIVETYCYLNGIVLEIEENVIEENFERVIKEIESKESIIDSTRLYLNEIGEIPLLTREEELELGKKCAMGDLNARNKLVESNLRFVITIAKKFLGRGVTFQDLIQAGNEGLIKAAEKFDFSKQNRFVTYAFHWIRNSIQREIYNNGKNIRVPVNAHEKYAKLKKLVRQIYQETGEVPSFQDLADRLGTTREKIENLYLTFNNSDTQSLNAPVNNDGEDNEFGMFVPSAEDLEDNVVNDANKKEVIDLIKNLKSLTEKERIVLILRYGFLDDNVMTLDSIGKIYGITRERVRQIEAKALNKLKFYKQREKKVITINNVEGFNHTFKIENFPINSYPLAHFYINPFDISSDDYLGIIKLLMSQDFLVLTKIMPEQDALIACLRLAYVNNKVFEVDEITNILGISEEEVKSVISKSLKLYKNELIKFHLNQGVHKNGKPFIIAPKEGI